MKLWYTQPATQTAEGWEQQSLPIGNGFIGANVFGGTEREYLHINEKTLWTGGPCARRPDYAGGNICGRDADGLSKADYFYAIRRLFSEGKEKEAAALCEKLTGAGADEGYGAYQSFGKFFITFQYSSQNGSFDEYQRELDLKTATASVFYKYKGIRYRRTYFANYPSNVLAGRLTAEQSVLSCSFSFDSDQEGSISCEKDGFTFSGALKDNDLRFLLRCKIHTDGLMRTDGIASITGASFIDFFIAAATDYAPVYPHYRTGKTPVIEESRFQKNFDLLYEEHCADYSSMYKRCCLDIGQDAEADKPTDILVHAYKKGNYSRRLEALLFQYGRYLLIASSREKNLLPANLQGMWNQSNTPPWGCDYHLNINLQMNYWPACTTGLAECCIPLVNYIAALEKPAELTAYVYTGIEHGLMLHTQNTPFGWTCPGWSFNWGWSPAALPWILQNLWQYYCESQDMERLQNLIYPLFKTEMDFYAQLLDWDSRHERRVFYPAYSPEHGSPAMGNTYEQSLIWELFRQGIQAALICGEDNLKIEKWTDILNSLKPIVIGPDGQILEWYTETALGSMGEKQHRHISHLLGLYPGSLISKENTELSSAAKISLEDRGDKSTGWAMAHRLNAWARLGEGQRSYTILQKMIATCIYDNLFAAHPPFQIDGNFGLTAGIAEIFLHCGGNLPVEWKGASFKLNSRKASI